MAEHHPDTLGGSNPHQSKVPVVDVVILTIDRPDDIHECIDSVQSQEGVEINLVVLDQGSRPSVVADLHRRSVREEFDFLPIERVGVAVGRNLGTAMGTAEVVVALDNDAVLLDHKVLRRAAERFRHEPSLGALAFAIHDYNVGGPDMSCWNYPYPAASHFDNPFPAARFVGAGHALRRSAFERVGGYDPQLFFFGEELDLSWSLIAAGYEIHYAPELGVRHKGSGDARMDWDSGRFYHNVRNMLYLNRKHFGGGWRNLHYAAGYGLKGLFNGHFGQALRGIRDGLALASDVKAPARLTGDARAWVETHELQPRGSALQRLRKEVVVTMPSTRGQPGKKSSPGQ